MSYTPLYVDSVTLARQCPRINISKPAPLDNTASQLRASGTTEPAREVKCWLCGETVRAGAGIQIPVSTPGLMVIVHPGCA